MNRKAIGRLVVIGIVVIIIIALLAIYFFVYPGPKVTTVTTPTIP